MLETITYLNLLIIILHRRIETCRFISVSRGGVKWIDIDLGNLLIEKDKDNQISLSYDNNIFIHSIGAKLLVAYPVDTWVNAGVIQLMSSEHNILHVTALSTQKYHIIVRVYYQNLHSIQS